MKINNLNIKPISIGGEVEKKMSILLPFIILLTLLFSHIPLMMFNISPFSKSENFKYFTYIWTAWYWISFFFMNKDKSINFVKIFLFFPLLAPLYFSIKIIHTYLKKLYPNSDEIKEIKRFERIKKLKQL